MYVILKQNGLSLILKYVSESDDEELVFYISKELGFILSGHDREEETCI